MTTPDRPNEQHQGPANRCVINGKALGWLSCTAYSMAMGIDRATLGAKRPSGCDVRREAGDTVGGLTLPQVAHAAQTGWGVGVEIHVGSSVTTPAYAAHLCAAGRGFVLLGNTGALLRTAFKCTDGSVNHAVWVNEVRGGTTSVPHEALVFDPAADGRRRGIDDGPSWWPWSLVLKFAADLRPWGDGDSRRLGSGRLYAGFVRDTEPHVHAKYGGVRTAPFPDRLLTNAAAGRRVNVRKTPKSMAASNIAARLPSNTAFVAYQKTTTGIKPPGSSSSVWYGNHDGTQWIHISGLKGIGGVS